MKTHEQLRAEMATCPACQQFAAGQIVTEKHVEAFTPITAHDDWPLVQRAFDRWAWIGAAAGFTLGMLILAAALWGLR